MPQHLELDAYHIPSTLDEALALLASEAEQGREAQLIAGGTDVLVRMREGRDAPRALIQIEALDELRFIEETDTHLRLGARTSFTDLLESDVVGQHAPILQKASFDVGAPQIQSRGTVGGQLGTASPVGDLIPCLLALDAEVHLRSAKGERRVAMADFLKGVGLSDRHPDELIIAAEVPKPAPGTHSLWHKIGPRRAQSISKVAFAGLVALEGGKVTSARLAYGAVAPTAIRVPKTEALLAGKTLTTDLIREAQALVQTEVTPITDLRSTEAYRRKMCGVMLRRGLASLVD